MSTHSSPDTMTWRFDGYELRLDEDGLSLHVHGSRRGFEQVEVLKLIERFHRDPRSGRNRIRRAPPANP